MIIEIKHYKGPTRIRINVFIISSYRVLNFLTQ